MQGLRNIRRSVLSKPYINSILKYLYFNTVSSVYCPCIEREPRVMMTKQNGTGNSKRPQIKTDTSQPIDYQIRIEGHLDTQWADWFSGLSITLEENGDTLLSGTVVDQ